MGIFVYEAHLDVSHLSVDEFIALLNKQKDSKYIRSILLHSAAPLWPYHLIILTFLINIWFLCLILHLRLLIEMVLIFISFIFSFIN